MRSKFGVVLAISLLALLAGCLGDTLTDLPLNAIPNSIENHPPTSAPTALTRATASSSGVAGGGGGGANCPPPNNQFTDSCDVNPPRFLCNDGTTSCAANAQGACSQQGGVCRVL